LGDKKVDAFAIFSKDDIFILQQQGEEEDLDRGLFLCYILLSN